RREEPLRVHQRGGGLRDGRARTRRGAEPVGGVPRRAPRRCPGLHRARDARGQPARPGRDPGAGLALGPGAPAPDGHRARRRAVARGGAPGVPPVRAAGDERARPRGPRRSRARGGRVARPALRRAGAAMIFLALFWLNVLLLAVFAVILMRPQLLGFAKGGKWYLTWLSIGVITLMDELTSVFYAPAEAHRFIGLKAIFFIAFTSLLMRVPSTRLG